MTRRPEEARLVVDLGSRSYPISIGAGSLDDADALAEALADRTVLVLSDENVAALYLDRFLAGAGASAGRIGTCVIQPGEVQKTVETWRRVLDALVEMGAQRDAVLVTLGGGVVGDLGGYAAASYMRGIEFVQCPTTLLAQVDSSVGGKTGVNHPGGKNLIGAFHQPRAVLIDVATLATLPAREFAAGVAETVKYGVIGSPGFFDWLEDRVEALAAQDPATLIEAVHRSCAAKADIVARDEREQGVRALLNLGHTFGHAIETCTGYARYLHGEAVAIGMGLAADLAADLGLCERQVAERTRALLARFDLPVVLPDDLDAAELWGAMQLDKKNRAGRVRLILPEGIGQARITDDVESGAVLAVLRRRGQPA